jgi:hypothetical protein
MRLFMIEPNSSMRAVLHPVLRSASCCRNLRCASLLLVAALSVAGCASGAPQGASEAAGAPTATRRDPNVISAEEIAASKENDLYSAIQRLRPAFLSTRGMTSLGNASQEFVQVYVDGSRVGDINSLRQIRPEDVKEIRHLTAAEATQAYGTGNTMGAIVVTRK